MSSKDAIIYIDTLINKNMIIRDFIKDLARAASDPQYIVTSAVDWLDIINSEGQSMFPDVLIETTTTLTWNTSTEIDETNNIIDLSGTTYTGISDIKDIYLVDSNGKRWPYDNYIYDRATKRIDLDPESLKTSDIFPSTSYPTVIINWVGRLGAVNMASTISLDVAEASLLKKICIKEALQKVLLDHIKLDRYRTLVARSNEGTILAIITAYNQDIEMDRKRLNNSNSVRSF